MNKARIPGLAVPVLCLLVAVAGCASAGGDHALSLGGYDAADGVYSARAPSMQSAERELGECLFRVAGQVSLRKAVDVRVVETPVSAADGSRLTRSQVSLDYDQSNSIAILDTLTVLKVVRGETGTEAVVRARPLRGMRVPSVSPSDRLRSDGNPDWVSRPPKGSGFVSAVGSIALEASSPDAYSYADMNAIGALARSVAKPTASGVSRVYEATLKGVFIARRWYNPREGRWYSLAILPR
jgi:hypothetical protein